MQTSKTQLLSMHLEQNIDGGLFLCPDSGLLKDCTCNLPRQLHTKRQTSCLLSEVGQRRCHPVMHFAGRLQCSCKVLPTPPKLARGAIGKGSVVCSLSVSQKTNSPGRPGTFHGVEPCTISCIVASDDESNPCTHIQNECFTEPQEHHGPLSKYYTETTRVVNHIHTGAAECL